MELEEIKDFLRAKPGYLHKGSAFMAEMLDADLSDCRKALRLIRKEFMKLEEKEEIPLPPLPPEVKISIKKAIHKSIWTRIKDWFKNLL